MADLSNSAISESTPEVRDWKMTGYKPPENALDMVKETRQRNNMKKMVDAELIKYIELATLCITAYSDHYENGRGLMLEGHVLQTDDFIPLLKDPDTQQPKPLPPHLRNRSGSEYNIWEDAFLVCSGAVCRSRGAAATLEALVSGRNRKKVLEHAQKFKWPKTVLV